MHGGMAGIPRQSLPTSEAVSGLLLAGTLHLELSITEDPELPIKQAEDLFSPRDLPVMILISDTGILELTIPVTGPAQWTLLDRRGCSGSRRYFDFTREGKQKTATSQNMVIP